MTRPVAVVSVVLACGCVAERPAVGPVGVTVDAPRAPVPEFAFDSLDARPVDGASFRGKPTVLTFFTTGDVASQAQANFLAKMAKHDGDRVNYAMVAMEPRAQRELVELYRTKLALPFPVALADEATLRGESPFGVIEVVPATFVLDATGAVRAQRTGLLKPEEIRATLPSR